MMYMWSVLCVVSAVGGRCCVWSVLCNGNPLPHHMHIHTHNTFELLVHTIPYYSGTGICVLKSTQIENCMGHLNFTISMSNYHV